MAATPNINSVTTTQAPPPTQVPHSFEQFSNYSRLVARVVDAFGDELKASRWLSLPNADLDGHTPLQAAEVDGYQGVAIEPLLIRMEHGIYY